MSDDTTSLPKNDPVAFTFLIAVALAAAVVTGASLSGIATGAIQDLLRTAGVGLNSEIRAEQHRQAKAIEKMEMSFNLTRADVALLSAWVEETERPHQETASSGADRADGEFDLGALRTSFDALAERNRNEFNAVNKRIDWLEMLVYNQDVTGSVPLPPRRQTMQSGPGWFVLHAEKGVAVIAGKSGAIDVTPGFWVPELGRVTAIRQEAGRWVVVTDKGMTIRER